MEDSVLLLAFAVIVILYLVCHHCRKHKKNSGVSKFDAPKPVSIQQLAKIQPPREQPVALAGEWNESIKQELENGEVGNSHRGFVKDTLHKTTGASTETVRSDDNDVNPWVGLRRPDYYSIYAGSDSRIVHSEDPGQMSAPTRHFLM